MNINSNNAKTLVSVIICTYNRCQSLKDTLMSLQEQVIDGSFDYEVIVVDNNSKDRTKLVIEEFHNRMDGKIRYLFEKRQGKSYALNKGIKEAKGEIIAFTDDDVTPDSCWLKNIYLAFQKTKASGVGGKTKVVLESQKPDWLAIEGDFALREPLAISDLGELMRENVIVDGCNMAFKSWVFEKYGCFREDLGPRGSQIYMNEDTEFCRRLIENGEKIIYSPNMVASHYIFKERLKKSYFRKWYFAYGRCEVREMLGREKSTLYLFGASRSYYKSLLRYLLKFLFYTIHKDVVKAFFYEVKIHKILGFITERWFYSKISLLKRVFYG